MKANAQQHYVKFIRKTKFPAKVLLWLAVSQYVLSEPVFFKFAVNKKLYISKCLPQKGKNRDLA
jgi:hypothetical protein